MTKTPYRQFVDRNGGKAAFRAPIPKGHIRMILVGGVPFDAPEQAQMFSFKTTDGKTGQTEGGWTKEYHLSIAYLLRLIALYPEEWATIEVPITEEDTNLLLNTRGVSMDHALSMSACRRNEPGIGLFLDDGSFLVADGNHRYVARAVNGHAVMAFHTCRSLVWQTALIDMTATTKLIRAGKAKP